ncbi:phage holin family protein [Rhodohalobacter sulfatireducens]|uniref:Phage holin family protein n=1 Tax=Rhodohalobacter sulfatireducens TaxID=2911366 RepID=A0ABS9KE46_9BACT|nr:phage holin family protein [Rhodohalobacter sulfatireducens]MCG2589136.1 phage holin family protein [Rhodohalobacter sulfatireducens]
MLKILIINSIVVFIGAYLLEGVKIKSFWTAIGVAIVLGLINMFIKPLIVLLTLPLTILTLGLFVLVINAWILMIIDKLIDGLTIKGFWWAVLYSIIISVLNSFMLWIF